MASAHVITKAAIVTVTKRRALEWINSPAG
jgi:hypothetical protein